MVISQLIFWFTLASMVSTVVSLVLIVAAPPGKRPPWFVYFLFHIGAYTLWLIVHSFLYFNLELLESGSSLIARGGEMVHLLVSIIIMLTYPPFILKITGRGGGLRTRLLHLAIPGLLLMVLLISFVIRSIPLLFTVNVLFNSYLLGYSYYGYVKLKKGETSGLRAAMRSFLGVAVILYTLLVLSVPAALFIPEAWFPDVGLFFSALFCFCWSFLMIRELLRMGLRPGEREMVRESFIRDYGISPREQDVLEKLVQGKTQRIIGDELFISTRTVEAHTARIYRKAGVRNRVDLLRLLQDA